MVDNAIYRLLISLSFPEIFKVKVKNCHKSHQILDGFWTSKFKGGGASPKVVLVLSPLPSGTSRGKVP